MKAAIITIGAEILIGQVVNTNAGWISEQLTLAGLQVTWQLSVTDESSEIIYALETGMRKADVLVLTGGLGPTKDDITKKTLAGYFNSPLARNEEVLQHIRDFFAKRNIEISPLNEQQADVPVNCRVLFNDMGTAPGMWFEKKDKIIISLPGVPHEMKNIILTRVLPALSQKTKRFMAHQTLLTSGAPESTMAELLNQYESELPAHIVLAYLPSPGMLRLRLTAMGTDKVSVQEELNRYFTKLEQSAADYVVGYNTDTLPGVIARLLTELRQSLSVAESCTGGKIASMITEIPGASSFFPGGIVAYSNAVKQNDLQVSPAILEQHGAVSKETVLAMARGVKNKFQTDFALSISGIAGPSGGTDQKPVGTVWIAIACPSGHVKAKKFNFGDNRELNILRASMAGFNYLRQEILNQSSIKKSTS
jgi:nicotinamide-nucleotide amidase